MIWEGAGGGEKDRNLRSNYPLKELEWPLKFCGFRLITCMNVWF